jgi:hypothetical protein
MLEVDFWFMAVSMDNSTEDFWLQYYDGSTWHTVATWARSIDFDNNVFYHETVQISSASYNFPTNAKLRFMCDASGNRDDVYIDEIEWRGGTGVTSMAKPSAVLPEKFAVSQNYPNPFNPVTTIDFSLPAASHVEITVFNIMGQKVATLADRHFVAGRHSIRWDASRVASGVYFYRVAAGERIETRKMMLLK